MSELNWIDELRDTSFESSSGYTPQFKSFYGRFSRGLKKYLTDHLHATNIIISRGHFEAYGFFTLPSGQIYYFRLGDVRFNKSFMIRTAMHNKDYNGSSNTEIRIASKEDFTRDMRRATEKDMLFNDENINIKPRLKV